MLQIHGSVMKSQNFPGIPDDHGIITDSWNLHRFRNYGKFREFRNVRSIVDKTRINPCSVKIKHGNIREHSQKIQVTNKSQKHKYFVHIFRFP